MANLHVADLDRKRQSRNGKKIRTHSPASSTGTFFDNDQSGDTQSLNTSWSGSTRADSAMSSRSAERKASETSQRQQTYQVKPPTVTSPALRSEEWSKGQRASTRLDMWPPALKITKSPSFEDPRPSPYPPGMLPNTVYEAPNQSTTSPNKYSPSAYSPSESVMCRPRPKMHRRLESSVHDDSSSSSSRNSDQSIYSALPDSAVSMGDGWTSKSTAARSRTPGSLNSLAAMGSAPREVTQSHRRSRITPKSPYMQTGGTTDWTAVAPSPRHRPEPLAKMPTPPLSPSDSITDMYGLETESADIVIGRRVTVKGRDRSSSVPESAMSPTSPAFKDMAFLSPPANSSRNTAIHCPTFSRDDDLISPCTVLQKELPPHPFAKRRSLSADEAGKRAKVIQKIEAEKTNQYRVMHLANSSLNTPSLIRPDRITVLTETLREMNTRSAAHYERYTRLRQGRQCLHSDILTALQGNAPRSKNAKTPLQLQIEIATIDAGIDDCMSKLSTLEKKRQKLMEELLSLTMMRSPSMHSGNESIGIQEMIRTPGSPLIGGMAAMMSNFSFEDKYSQKTLPKIPRKEVLSQASLSLTNIMDFLDTDDQDGY